MNFYCPRCRSPLHADVPRGRPSLVTCPSCLERITVNPPAPIPAIPISPADAAHLDRPLEYRPISGDVEAELKKDMQASLIGICAFAIPAVAGYFFLKSAAGLPGPTVYWLGWIGFVTTIIALTMLARHARRSQQLRAGAIIRPQAPGQRAVKIIVLGISGLLMIGLTLVAAVVLLFVACLVVMGSGGKF